MWSSETEKGPPVAQSHSLRDFEQHLGDLKKENFSLKLRIYFLEERVRSQTPDQDQDLSRTNIELNVQLQSLKKELEEKEQLLQQALDTAELVSNQSAVEQKQQHEATNQIQESLEARLRQLQQEQQLQKEALEQKDRFICELSTENASLELKVQDLSSALRTRPQSEQGGVVCVNTTERCLTELHSAQSQVHTLQTKIRISEDRNKLLQKRLGEMELELREVREEAQEQERNLQLLQDSLISKDQQVADLHRAMEEQNRALISLKEAAVRQFSSSPACGVTELQMMLQQKSAVDRELHELKTQLNKTGFSSLSQIRKALLDLRTQNQDLKQQLSHCQEVTSQRKKQGAETEEESDQWEGWENTSDHAQVQTEVADQDSPLHRGAVDLGYETCERSETEAERDTSSPEFDDLELCLSLDHGSSHWWTPQNQSRDQDQDSDLGQTKTPTLSPDSAPHRQVQELQRLVQRLRSELQRSQIQVQKLQTETGSEARSESELDPDLANLLSRVESLENQFKTESNSERQEDSSRTRFLGLVHLQARELSRLRQVLRESRGLVQILVQSRTELLKGLEDLLVTKEPDYGLGLRLREQLREGHDLLLRLRSKISLKDLPEDPDDKSELLAMRLSKELQQKDLLIESLRSKLRPDTPTDSTDQSDRISYVSDEQLSNQDEDLGSESNSELQLDQSLSSDRTSGQSERGEHYDGQSERTSHYDGQSQRRSHYDTQSERRSHYDSQSERRSHCSSQLERSQYDGQSERFYGPPDPRFMFSSVPPSIASTHSFPMMPGHAPSALLSALKPSLGAPSAPHPTPPDPQPAPPQTLSSGQNPGPGFSLAEVHQELQLLQKQLQNSHSGSLRPLPVVALAQSGFSSSSLDSGLRPGVRPGHWDAPFSRPLADHLSPGGHSLSDGLLGAGLIAEHLGEVRSLRLRLEESIQTNERLRNQLETRQAPPTVTAPTNIYIQGAGSADSRVLQETSLSLRQKLYESLMEAEGLREKLLLVETRMKEAKLQAQRWEEQSRSCKIEANAQRQEVTRLRQEQQGSLEVIQRLQDEVTALQQLHSQSERSADAIDLSEQRQGSRSQSGAGVEQAGTGPRRRQKPKDSDPDQDLDLDQEIDSPEASGPGPDQDSLQLQRCVQDAMDLLQTMDRPLKNQAQSRLRKDLERLKVLLKEAQSLSSRTRMEPETSQVQKLMSEVSSLRLKLSERDQALRETSETVQRNSRSHQALEQMIVSQLSRTRDVLRTAKTNLQETHRSITVS